jgi:hypothetical protein
VHRSKETVEISRVNKASRSARHRTSRFSELRSVVLLDRFPAGLQVWTVSDDLAEQFS